VAGPVHDGADNRRYDGTTCAAAEQLANDRTEIEAARSVGRGRKQCSQQLSAAEAAERPCDAVADTAKIEGPVGGASRVPTNETGNNLND
jgi:hypothetical protein